MSIRLFVTGGTYSKEYDEIKEQLVFRETQVPQILDIGRCKVDVAVRTLMMIDSRDMTNEQRYSIANACKSDEAESIVIVHGTSTMVETAKVLAEEVPEKTIVMTGAMIPYLYSRSDAMFNLGSAIAFAQVLVPGVYVAMNGRYFLWNNVRKNEKTGLFEELV